MAMTHDTLTNGVNPESGIHGGIHGKKFLYILTRVAKTGNLVLTAQFAFALEPFIEESWFGNDDFERLKGDVLMALGFIVGVDGLKRTVEDDCKLINRGWCFRKIDDPLMTALGIAVHEDGGCSEVFHLRTCGNTGLQKSFLCIVHNQFLAKGVDEVLGTTCDAELVGVFL